MGEAKFGEPWREHVMEAGVIVNERGAAVLEAWLRDDRLGRKTQDRILACVNACAGMDDPAAEIESLRARVAEAEGFEVAMRHTAKILPNAGISNLIAEWDANGPGADAALAAGEGGD